MSYAQTLEKAWTDLAALSKAGPGSVAMLSDKYDIDPDKRTVISVSCNIPAKDHVAIILLHYLVRKLTLKTLPQPTGEWIDFRELEGGDGYYPAFKKRTIGHIIKKYGDVPEALVKISERLPVKRLDRGGGGIIINALEGVNILITLERSDEEFGPDANILFDSSIKQIFCTEDIVVLTEFVVHSL